jgi:hypothetical protein
MYARLALIKQTAEDACAPTLVSSVRGEPDADVPMAASPGDAPPEPSGASSSSNAKSGSGAGGDGGAEMYRGFLASVERLFDGALESLAFEDAVRASFGAAVAFNVFTIDKLAGAVVKQVRRCLGGCAGRRAEEVCRCRRCSRTRRRRRCSTSSSASARGPAARRSARGTSRTRVGSCRTRTSTGSTGCACIVRGLGAP